MLGVATADGDGTLAPIPMGDDVGYENGENFLGKRLQNVEVL